MDEQTATDEQTTAEEQAAEQRYIEGSADDENAEAIDHPTKLMRVAHMVRTMLDEVRTTDLDEAGRARLAAIHRRSIEMLKGVVSDELGQELDDVTGELSPDDVPTGSELRVVQAQLAGWLEGLFRGIQATMMSQQAAVRDQLQQQQALERGGEGARGQYL